MPTYTFKCEREGCAHMRVITQSIHEDLAVPTCDGHGPMRRKYDPPAVQVH